jgi:hypothetical protein
MLRPLRSERRRSLLRGSLLSLSAALLVSPLAFPPALPAQAGASTPHASQDVPSLEDPREPQPVIARDPFVPEASVANADASAAAGDPNGTGIAIEAVALGSEPRALVEIGGVSRIVRAGDSLGESKVLSIGEGGVVLEDGQTLPLTVPR